jgi:hypothetical protein
MTLERAGRELRFLTVEEKQAELAAWDALCRASRADRADEGGRGFPDADMIPWCATLNAIPGVCTVQSCAGHGSVGHPGYVSSAHLWLRLDKTMSAAFDAEAFALAANNGIESVVRAYTAWGKEIASITFAGNERDSLNDSMAMIAAFLQSLRERCHGVTGS